MQLLQKMKLRGQASGVLGSALKSAGLPVERNPAPKTIAHLRVSSWSSGAWINPSWALRLGLGLMYIYSGYDLFYNPQHWYGFVPQWFSSGVTSLVSIEAYLRFQGVGEFIIGLLFLAWFSGAWGVRIASALAVLEMALIIIFVGIDPITFRDIGLLGAAIAILGISFQETRTDLVRDRDRGLAGSTNQEH